MSRVEIRPMMREDLPAVEAIEHEGFSLPWPKDAFAHELENALARYLVLVEEMCIRDSHVGLPAGGGAAL